MLPPHAHATDEIVRGQPRVGRPAARTQSVNAGNSNPPCHYSCDKKPSTVSRWLRLAGRRRRRGRPVSIVSLARGTRLRASPASAALTDDSRQLIGSTRAPERSSCQGVCTRANERASENAGTPDRGLFLSPIDLHRANKLGLGKLWTLVVSLRLRMCSQSSMDIRPHTVSRSPHWLWLIDEMGTSRWCCWTRISPVAPPGDFMPRRCSADVGAVCGRAGDLVAASGGDLGRTHVIGSAGDWRLTSPAAELGFFSASLAAATINALAI